MYKNILVPLDPAHPEKHAHAVAVARSIGAEGADVTAIMVTEPIPAYIANELPAELRGAADKRAEAMLAEAKAVHGLTRVALLHGRPGSEIVDYASANDIDCIIVFSHKPDISDYFLGSTAGRVVRRATCSVHVMR